MLAGNEPFFNLVTHGSLLAPRPTISDLKGLWWLHREAFGLASLAIVPVRHAASVLTNTEDTAPAK